MAANCVKSSILDRVTKLPVSCVLAFGVGYLVIGLECSRRKLLPSRSNGLMGDRARPSCWTLGTLGLPVISLHGRYGGQLRGGGYRPLPLPSGCGRLLGRMVRALPAAGARP